MDVPRRYFTRVDAKIKETFRRKHPTLVRVLLLILTFGWQFGAGVAYGAWALVCRGGQCPPVDSLNDYTPRQTSKLYAADGSFIAELGLERRTLVKLDEIPVNVRQAFVITEDKRFYTHAGIDWTARLRSACPGHSRRAAGTKDSRRSRCSSLEMFSPSASAAKKRSSARSRKERSRVRSKHKFDKKKILELYLNQINLGNGAYGVETASQRYFGKSVRNLNIAEGAMLAALPKAPERYNPKRHPERAIQRRNTVIELMRRNGAISDVEAREAKALSASAGEQDRCR